MNEQVGGRALSHFLSFRITLYPVPPDSQQAREQTGQKTARVTAPQPASGYGSAMPEGGGTEVTQATSAFTTPALPDWEAGGDAFGR